MKIINKLITKGFHADIYVTAGVIKTDLCVLKDKDLQDLHP